MWDEISVKTFSNQSNILRMEAPTLFCVFREHISIGAVAVGRLEAFDIDRFCCLLIIPFSFGSLEACAGYNVRVVVAALLRRPVVLTFIVI